MMCFLSFVGTPSGVGPEIASILWSESVAAEIIVFVLIGPVLVRQLGPRAAAMLAAGAGLFRWLVASQTTSVAVFALIQPLHGITFALLHLACMRLIGAIVPVCCWTSHNDVHDFFRQLVCRIWRQCLSCDGILCGLALPLAWMGLRSNG
jgi:PPP family 3-phenylpropionic acid transporter